MSKVKKELKAFASLAKGAQRDYYLSMLRDAKDVDVVSINDAFCTEDVVYIHKHLKPRIKECYRNAFLLAQMFPDYVEYVEGRVSLACLGGLSIEHAWNKVGDKYVDVTMELVLNEREAHEYAVLGEYTYAETVNVMISTGVYGGVYEYFLKKQLNEQNNND